MLKKIVGKTALVTLATVAAASVPSSAQALGSVDPATYTLFDSCRDYSVQVTGSMPGAASWDYDLTLYAPSGEASSFDFNYGDGATVDERATFSVCASEGVGNYTVEGTLSWEDADYNSVGSDNLTGTLRMVRQRTKSALRVSDTTPAYNSRVRLTMRSLQQTPSGWRNNAYEYVALERKCGTGWSRVRGSKSFTDAYGKAVLTYRWNTRRTCRVRTVTLPTTNSAVSRSSAIIVNPH